jgi:hypothetical protein
MDNGSPPMGSTEFHQLMRDLYANQASKRRHEMSDGLTIENQYHVQAKLPAALYKEFHDLLKERGWSISTGVQYAIHKLSQQKEQAS